MALKEGVRFPSYSLCAIGVTGALLSYKQRAKVRILYCTALADAGSIPARTLHQAVICSGVITVSSTVSQWIESRRFALVVEWYTRSTKDAVSERV